MLMVAVTVIIIARNKILILSEVTKSPDKRHFPAFFAARPGPSWYLEVS
jgi:hypothetical protein